MQDVDILDIFRQPYQMLGYIFLKKKEDEAGDQKRLHSITGEEDNDSAQQPLINPVQRGDHMQPAYLFRTAAKLMKEGKDTGDAVAQGWSTLAAGAAQQQLFFT